MRRAALLVLGIGSPVLLLALLLGGWAAGLLFPLVSLSFPTALCILGASRGRGGTAWRWLLPVLGLVLLLSGAALLVFGSSPRGLARVLGLPPETVLLIAGLGLLPLLLTGFGYAADFRRPAGESGPSAEERRPAGSD